ELCAPADKNGESPGAENHPDHLLCYDIKSRQKFQDRDTFLNNQFGEQRFEVRGRDLLCVPSQKNPGATTTTTAPTTSTTTTTGPSTTTSTPTTTTTTSPLCGNGVLDPGEQCDGSNFGSFTCPSPGGALLCTSDCKIDFSECPSASSTSTTGTVPTTTSTTVTTSTTGTVPTTTSTTVTTSTTGTVPTTTSTTVTTSTTATIPPTTTSTTETIPPTTTSSTTTPTTSTTSTTQPSPTVLDFVLSAATGSCGDTRDASNTVIKSLTGGGLSIGAGASLIPEGPTPDGSQSRFSLSCTGASCNIGPTSTAPATNSADPDCTNTGCNFGTPLPIPNPTIPGITSCVLNTWNAPARSTPPPAPRSRPSRSTPTPTSPATWGSPVRSAPRPGPRAAPGRAPATAGRAPEWPAPRPARQATRGTARRVARTPRTPARRV